MLTKLQTEMLKNISDSSVKRKYLKFFQLSQELQEIIPSIETADKIRAVAKKNGLDKSQLWSFSYIVGMVLLGETSITEFVKEIQKKCELDEKSARQVARDINQLVFLPVKEELKEIHNIAQWPREKESTASITLPEPKIEGNVVDLKTNP